jgi:short-subunit dehydrogenase
MQLAGAHVLVTGGSRGIGAAIAREYARRDATVSVAARDGAALDRVATELRGRAFVADLLDPAQVDGLIDRVEASAGPVDVLVNNAGMESIGAFHKTDPSVIRDTARLNFEVPMVLTRQVLPGMLQRRRGHVVFLSSLGGTGGFAGLAVYSGTKAGLNNFVASIRMELKDTPITTTVVAPGPVDTEMWDRVEDATEYAAMLKRLRLFRLLPKATPEFVACKTVDATASATRHVRMPRRLLVNHLLREAPTRITEGLTTGVVLGPQIAEADDGFG